VVEKEEGIACKGETVELPKGKVHKACPHMSVHLRDLVLMLHRLVLVRSHKRGRRRHGVHYSPRPRVCPICALLPMLDQSNKLRHSLDEQWLNNLYGILDSHYHAKKPVSFLQLMVIWDESASAPGAVPKPIGVLMSYVFGKRSFPSPHAQIERALERTHYWTACGL